MTRRLLIWRDHWLPPSEQFLLRQAECLTRYSPQFAGLSRDPFFVAQKLTTAFAGSNHVSRRMRQVLARETGHSRLVGGLLDPPPALVHAHFGPDGATIAPFAKRARLPLVVTMHGYDATLNDDSLRALGRKGAVYLRRRRELQRTAHFIAVSDFVRDRLVQAGARSDRVKRLYLGTDIPDRMPTGARERKALFVGRLVPNKGAEHAIRACAPLIDLGLIQELVVIGDGPEQGRLRQLAATLRTRVQFLGVQPREVVNREMERSLALCVPSVEVPTGASEGFGLVVIEAAARGVPTVGFSTGGLSEAVVHDETGLLVPPGQTHLLSDALRFLLSEDETRNRFSVQAYSRASSKFDIRRCTGALEDHFDFLLQDTDITSNQITA